MDTSLNQQNTKKAPTVTISKDAKKDESKSATKGNGLYIILGIVVLVLAGVGTGYALSKTQSQGVTTTESGTKIINNEKQVGMMQENFSDSAEGVLEDGGIDGEGTHHLVRDGGPSQFVYLTSSVVNLGNYTGKKVKVWGETNSAQKAGWLMDVGRLELQE